MEKLRTYWQRHPLTCILLVAGAARLIAVFFAPGYFWHDDHFLTVEPSASWAAGSNFNDWLPGVDNAREHPEPISFFYLGFLMALFKLLHFLGIDHPGHQMDAVRFIHALYSLITIYCAWRIANRLGGIRAAKTVGLLLALLAIAPNFSTRNLVEWVCIPPLLAGFWIIIRYHGPNEVERKPIPYTSILLAALFFGLAAGMRYQTVILAGGVGLWLLLQRQVLKAMVFGLTAFATFFLTQIDDVLLWGGQPFQHLLGYFGYNAEHASQYPGSPLTYLSFIAIFIFPPVSFFLLTGFIASWKKHLIITLPVTLFIVFHILYPNKQERFILPALPLFVIAGVLGWQSLIDRSSFWMRHVELQRGCWRFFWIANTVAMLVLSTTYGKKARVEAMLYIYEQRDGINFLKEASASGGASMPPQYYSGLWTRYAYIENEKDAETILASLPDQQKAYENRLMKKPLPNYFLFYDDVRLDERVSRVKKYFPNLTFEKTIEPGWFDILLHRLNSKNALERIHIFKVE